MTKNKKTAIKVLSVAGATFFGLGLLADNLQTAAGSSESVAELFTNITGVVNTNPEKYFDDSVVYELPKTVAKNDDISVIVEMNTDAVMDTYGSADAGLTVSEYVVTDTAKKVAEDITKQSDSLIKRLNKSGIKYELGERYTTILSGFEITIKAKDFEKVGELFSSDATLIIGETYKEAKTEVVTNEVDVYTTGIFDSSSCEYQGDGVVVAVLDTGLDSTHSAFSVANFATADEDLAFTEEYIGERVGQTRAASYQAGLTEKNVYLNKKVPYAYDYADKDAIVEPINSAHGTHVAGIIAGKDDTITGVAPNAQLAIMKIFSDTAEGSKTSWMLAALEDCVVLGVDVINMSVGSSCGFAREVDKQQINHVYDKIKEAGISLIVSAGNSYNATMGSTKNGNLGLTSNPDSGTVGSPSTYTASLSVASVSGVKTPYLTYKGQIIYFNEASTAAKTRNFVNDILSTVGSDVTSHDFEYVTIPGIGRSTDYLEENSYYAGKIVLVKRGTTTFEDKVRIALKEKGAAGIIIYNNVSGTISMSVGSSTGASCSISQDDGELLAAAGTGILTISTSQAAGPFMSDFSSWGPTSDLEIKPEITSHGGEILSAVPGGEYERMSGTSMAAPNEAGAAALIRQYVRYSGVFGTKEEMSANPVEVTSLVNQLMMSTADIVYNKNGLPYAVRKQGAGLMNITAATTSAAYITSYDKNGVEMDRTKFELGDDKEKTGVYEMKMSIHNISSSATSYDVGGLVITEGVSSTYTSHGETTVTQDGYLLSGSETTVYSVENGEQNGNTISVGAGKTATIYVRITLSSADKEYLDKSFENGMYVEGFVTFAPKSGTTVKMNAPFLAFYGDWTQAPIFDEEYYDTNADELNAALDDADKMMPDAYATRVIGSLYSDYITTLGSYYFVQDPAMTPIAASKDHISISNQDVGAGSTTTGIRSITAGLLRNVKEVNISIVEDSTGREIFNKVTYNQRKSFSSGSNIYGSSIDVDFSTLQHDLKNNTKYTVTVTCYIDYGDKADQKNTRNTFEFPLYVDFEAPVLTDVTYRTETDRTTKKTKLYADLNIYDNHYAMGVQLGRMVENPAYGTTSEAKFAYENFGKYITAIQSSYNSTSKVSIELTDYISQIKNSVAAKYLEGGTVDYVYGNNTFIVNCYDYAMNSAMYEVSLPDDVLYMYFSNESEDVKLSPNQTLDIASILNIYPSDSWIQALDFTSSDSNVAEVVNQTIIARTSGTARITAIGRDAEGNEVLASVNVHVYAPDEEGYNGNYTAPEVNKFTITSYKTLKAFYSVSTSERDIGLTDGTYNFAGAYNLSMYPSESVALKYELDSYFPDKTQVVFKSTNERIVTVTEDGVVVAQAKGNAYISVSVTFNGKTTLYSGRVAINVKDPFIANSIYLMSYKGLGGEVVIPGDLGLTTIYPYAFSNYEYVDKDLAAGDVIDEEDPYFIKQSYLGEDTITKIVIPEGVTEIQSHAFAGLTALEEVVMPSTLTKIGSGAFTGCNKLKKINLEYAKFINQRAFSNCALEEVNLAAVVAIGNYAFENCKLTYLELPATAQSLGVGAFLNNTALANVEFKAAKVKIDSKAFEGCSQLTSIKVNASVISSYAFYNCSSLVYVELGRDVAEIGEYAFAKTKVAQFTIDSRNKVYTLENDGAVVYKGTELVLVAPGYAVNSFTTNATSIATGAFSGNAKIFRVYADSVETVGAYAFAGCTNLTQVSLNSVKTIGNYAFSNTALTATPNLNNVESIGAYAFAVTPITSVTIAENTNVGPYAFFACQKLATVVIGNNAVIGRGAFDCPIAYLTYEATGSLAYYTNSYTYEVTNDLGEVVKSYNYRYYDIMKGVTSVLTSVTVGDGVVLGDYCFAGSAKLTGITLGSGVSIGDCAFYNAVSLSNIDLSEVEKVGVFAFACDKFQEFAFDGSRWSYAYEREYLDGKVVERGYKYRQYSPTFTTVDLSNAKTIGNGAFSNITTLTSVVIGDNVTSIADNAFDGCVALTSVTGTGNMTKIGDYAFRNTAITSIDIEKATTIGKYAFANTGIVDITLADDAVVDDGAFAYCTNLATVNGLDKVKTIGAYGFASTALTDISLNNVESIGDFAFANAKVTNVAFGNTTTIGEDGTVVIGKAKLVSLGENPFYACEIATFGIETNELFNGVVVGTKLTETYDVSDSIKVIDGVLYQTIKTGLELVTYPIMKTDAFFTVEEGTSRITARAFAYSNIQNVTLPSTLLALGDKAFYGCSKLASVIFRSYYAPILEETYDASYAITSNLASNMVIGDEKYGLDITKYHMWNTSSGDNFYYGANFVNYIGKISSNIVMVKPANGQNYNTFILSQYFGTTVEGSNAATQATLNVIAIIGRLPATVTLASEAEIVAARAAYSNLGSLDQQALVSNYEKLTAAEANLAYLKYKENPTSDDSSTEEEKNTNAGNSVLVVGIVVVVVLVAAVVAVVVVMQRKKSTSVKNAAVEAGNEIANADNTANTTENTDVNQEKKD